LGHWSKLHCPCWSPDLRRAAPAKAGTPAFTFITAYAAARVKGLAWAAIQDTQCAQLVQEPGVMCPSKRGPAAPVAPRRLAGTPSMLRAARPAKATALRASAAMP